MYPPWIKMDYWNYISVKSGLNEIIGLDGIMGLNENKKNSYFSGRIKVDNEYEVLS